MPSPRPNIGDNALRELSRVHTHQLVTYAAARLRLQRRELLTPRDRARLAAADAVLGEIRGLLRHGREDDRAAVEQEG